MAKRKIKIKIDNDPVHLEDILQNTNSIFEVPKYQRNYSWSEDNWEEFIETIDNGDENYFGTLFLLKLNNGKKYHIIDGQQRLTTINILIKALELTFDEGLTNRKFAKKIEGCVERLFMCRYETSGRGKKQVPRVTIQEIQGAQKEFKSIMELEFIPDSIDFVQKERKLIDKKIEKTAESIDGKDEILSRLKKKIKSYKRKNSAYEKAVKEKNKTELLISKLRDELKLEKENKSLVIQRKRLLDAENKGRTDTQKKIRGAFNYFIKSLSNKDQKYLEQFFNKLMSNILFIRMVTTNPDSVYEYFKSLNATGVQLAASDILKNNIISKLPSNLKQRDETIEKFEGIIEKLGENNLNFDNFLLHSINSREDAINLAIEIGLEKKPINKNKILKAYDELLEKNSAITLVDSLDVDINNYVKIVNPDKNSNLKLDKEEFYYYYFLKQMVPSKPISFLLASRRKHKDSDHFKLCKMAIYVSIRHQLLPGRDMKTLEGHFYKARKALHESKSIAPIIEVFKDTTAFKAKATLIDNEVFAQFNWSNSQALALNCLLHIKEIKEAPKNTFYINELSAEHIMPQKPNKKTKEYWHQDNILDVDIKAKKDNSIYDSFAQEIGNYIILWGGDNSSVGNKSFTDKKKTYAKYPYKHIKTIAKNTDWTQSDIQKRSKKLFNLFEKLKTT